MLDTLERPDYRLNRSIFARKSGFEVTSRPASETLLGRVVVSPPVWLCCVYAAAPREQRIDPQQEARRMDRLLQAASIAWLNHTRVTGRFARHCVFPFRASDEHDDELPIRLEVTEDRENSWTTRLELAA